MYAKFLSQDKLVVNSADDSEQLILADYIDKANSKDYEIVINKLLDINGNTSGVCLEVVKNKEEETE
ncbi:MAG: hypothetical protein J6T15_05220 [Bacilli bacterium]|nr:hypothetical protein [Bacilli bacterium]